MGTTLYSKRYNPRFGRNRRPRPKTFNTQEAAKKWAQTKGLTNFEIVPAKKDKWAVKTLELH
ncbi:MAG: hypothetical protein QXK37_01485 [Candidatus Woesearchaeota archaeon]